MRLRTKGEQKAYLDGYKMCAECIENYLSDEDKIKLKCLLSAVRNAVEIEDICKKSEEGLDWLYRLRSEIYVYMPKEWLIPMNNALDLAISALSENKGEWIPVSERLPEERQSVLVWCPERRNIYCACLEKEQWWIFGAFMKVQDEVVAWMPLPEPYKAEKGGEE